MTARCGHSGPLGWGCELPEGHPGNHMASKTVTGDELGLAAAAVGGHVVKTPAAERRLRIQDRLDAWVHGQDHYYVGYEFKGSRNMPGSSFESLVDEIVRIVDEESRR